MHNLKHARFENRSNLNLFMIQNKKQLLKYLKKRKEQLKFELKYKFIETERDICIIIQ